MSPVMPRPVAFVHIPKTGGMSLASALIASTKANRIGRGFDLSLFGASPDLHKMAPDVRSTVHPDIAALPRDADLVLGHKALSTLQTVYPEHATICVLREARLRIVSHWLYWRSMRVSDVERWGGLGAFIRSSKGSFRDFLANPATACQIDNCATRMLLWPHDDIPDAGFIASENDADLLAAAMERLRALDFVACLEDADLDARLGVFLSKPFVRARENETRASADVAVPSWRRELDDETWMLLQERSRLDQALWQSVNQNRATHLATDTRLRVPHESERVFLFGLLGYVNRGLATVD